MNRDGPQRLLSTRFFEQNFFLSVFYFDYRFDDICLVLYGVFHRFRNLIRPDEQTSVEASIWQQIDSGASGDNDYVRFHFVRKDGSTQPVLDHGRIVKNRYYGNIFYVLIMDCALIESYYDSDK